MRTFSTNEGNDLYLDKQGNLSLAEDIHATAQASRNFASTRRAEMIHAMDLGIPFFQTTFDRFPSMAQLEASLRRRLLEIETVRSVTSLDVQYTNGEIKYTATLQTDDGALTING